jgi:hypothetical protein
MVGSRQPPPGRPPTLMGTTDPLSKKNPKAYFCIYKILKTNQDVASDVYNKCANYQLEIVYIFSYMKMIKV